MSPSRPPRPARSGGPTSSRTLGSSGAIADLTIGYRVPEPILEVANRLLPLTGVDAAASRSVRSDGPPPAWHTADGAIGVAAANVVARVKHRHRLTGVVAPPEIHREIADELAAAGFVAVDHVHDLGHDDVPLFGPEAVRASSSTVSWS